MIQSMIAIAFTGFLYVTLIAVIAFALHRSPYTIRQSLLYFVNVLITRLHWRAKAPSNLPIPIGQGAVLIANHRSSVDPCFVQLSAGRVVHWMVAADFVNHPFIGWLFRFCEAIPTKRSGADVGSTKKAIRLAKNGGLIGMFPEGRINRGSEFMQSVRPGAALIALAAGVPLIPCYIEGSPYDGSPLGAVRMSARVTMKLGEPIWLEEYEGMENDKSIQAKVMLDGVRAISELAGRDDFEPQLAGRKWHEQCQHADG